ncbi:MAG: hypothetical protein IKI93_07820, partial [Clostridia bacterium]|nr:hypothetical protein [Clostridia bacterium]
MKLKKSAGERTGIAVTAVLALLLAFLAAATIIMVLSGVSNRNSVPFDLDSITSQKNNDSGTGTMLLLPSIIGITSEDARYASSTSAATTAEIYRAVLPTVAEVLGTPGTPDESENLWESFISRKSSVYIRYHHEF